MVEKMKSYRTILIIGIIEILIGSITILSNFISLLFSLNKKPPNVLLFVLVAGGISTFIGIGILKYKKAAYQLLLYFSSVVLLSKLLIFLDIIKFTEPLETMIPNSLKDIISVFYHIFVIYYLSKDNVKQIFHN